MEWSEILAFSIVATLLVISPGPNSFLIAKTVPSSGRVAGFANILGFSSAFLMHGTFSILGLSIILVNSAIAFSLLKYVGAAYLVWVGIKALHSALKGEVLRSADHTAKENPALWKAFGEGFLTNALNPKVSMFYLAAFPQFLGVEKTTTITSFSLVFAHIVIATFWFGSMVFLFDKLRVISRKNFFQRWVKGATGVVFIGLGTQLARYRPE